MIRWRSCLYGLVLRAADGAAAYQWSAVARYRSPEVPPPNPVSRDKANFKRWSTGSFHFDSRVHWRQNPIARQSKIFVPILLTGKDQVTMGMTPFY